MASVKEPPTAIIFPFMAQGHTLPLLDLAKEISHRGLKVTIITTPSNSKQISSTISNNFSNISTHIIPFPTVDGLPEGCENTKDMTSPDQLLFFLRASFMLKGPFESYLREMIEQGSSHHPVCVICDFFLGWVLPICSSFNIPAILFHGMGVLPTALGQITALHPECIRSLSDEEELHTLPGLTCPFPLTQADFPHLMDDNDQIMQFFYETRFDPSSCWGILSNSFEGLEGSYISVLESLYKEGVKVWCVGPFHLYSQPIFTDETRNETKSSIHTYSDCSSSSYKTWLDQQGKSESVIYVSLGSVQAFVSNSQMDEIALGLEMAGYPFIWAVGSTSWTPPEGLNDRLKGKGLIIREWVDQRSILEHPSIGGFLSHCGWNSVLEGLSRGVPLLACPICAEQPLNSKLVVEVLKAGIAVNPCKEEGKEGKTRFRCNDISSGVKELMGGDKGRLARERAKEIGEMGRDAVKQGGSSSKKLDQLIKCLTEMREDM